MVEFEDSNNKLYTAFRIYEQFFDEDAYYYIKSVELNPSPLYKAIMDQDVVTIGKLFQKVKETVEEILMKLVDKVMS